MFTVGDIVYVNKQGRSSYVGKGNVTAVCRTLTELHEYFQEEHPFYDTYVSWIKKEKSVYIVELESSIGKAGFLEEELTHELIGSSL
ncbi:hypothetical protein [Alteribacter natronophilus]|uniref:hypothetical protein n=1 Tax=Alteribacter natronophilus TaxID=2583810 RepID=UPI00110F1433|nr:hypothetical protein [Alteribacter natronophilus]TMW73391.1 hypothetical protein FGB90_03550 [Alteribacter natronophilus]